MKLMAGRFPGTAPLGVPGRPAQGLLADGAVDPLTQQVGVTKMTGVLLDQVLAEPAQCVRVRRAERVAELVSGHDLTGASAVLAECLQVGRGLSRGRPLEVTVLVLVGAVQEADAPVSESVPVEPLHLGHS